MSLIVPHVVPGNDITNRKLAAFVLFVMITVCVGKSVILGFQANSTMGDIMNQ